jgi:hypothetical protein
VPVPHPRARSGPSAAGRRLLALTAVLLVAAALVPGNGGTVLLVLAGTALTGSAVLSMRARWIAVGAQDEPPVAALAAPADPAAVLQRLRGEHLARVDAALDAGRHDLARALVDAHQEQVARLLSRRPARPAG